MIYRTIVCPECVYINDSISFYLCVNCVSRKPGVWLHARFEIQNWKGHVTLWNNDHNVCSTRLPQIFLYPYVCAARPYDRLIVNTQQIYSLW